MLIDTVTLSKDERTYLELGSLYERHGYALYKMKKFEEYSLYLDNKNFLGSESVLTFQGFGGKLMALKPDVTLSIVKNARVPEKGSLRLYYRESVYRTERGGTDFKEINQMGLECIGALTGADVREICALAAESLALIDGEFVFAVSHMGYLSALIDECGVKEADKHKVIECVRARNAHDLSSAAGEDHSGGHGVRRRSRAAEIVRRRKRHALRRRRTGCALRQFRRHAVPRQDKAGPQHRQRRRLLQRYHFPGLCVARAQAYSFGRQI